MSKLLSVNEVRKMIEAGNSLLLAGDESLLDALPAGNWIGGTIPYFMSERGGLMTEQELYVTELPGGLKGAKIKTYDEREIANVAADAFEDGFSFIIIPAFSNVHSHFAENVYTFENIFVRPLLGWVSGLNLGNLGKATPKAFDGRTKSKFDSKAVVMHLELAKDRVAKIDIVNLFTQGKGDVITFPATGFGTKMCKVNGETKVFADYLKEKQIDTKLPLVANYSGAMINVSFQGVDEATKQVSFYAPVFSGVEYRIAAPVANYEKDFTSAVQNKAVEPLFSCNCILNYLYAGLEGKQTGKLTGPMTFGEIAYGLLNQTLVYLSIDKI